MQKKIKNRKSRFKLKSSRGNKTLSKIINGIQTTIKISFYLMIILLILFTLIVSPIITLNYQSITNEIEHDTLEDISLNSGDFYFRFYYLTENHTLEYDIDKIPIGSSFVILFLTTDNLAVYPNGTYDIDEIESIHAIETRNYYRGEFTPPKKDTWVIFILNPISSMETSFDIEISVISITEVKWVNAFNFIDSWTNTILTPFITIATIIGFLWGVIKLLDLIDEDNDNSDGQENEGYTRKKYGVWIK